MKAIDDVERIFLMIPWLEQHPGLTLAEAAEHFDIRPERLRHELEQLSMIGADPEAIAQGRFGYLIDFEEFDDGTFVVRPSEYVQRPLNLTADQALSLVIGLRALQPLVSSEATEHVASALAKLERLTGDAASRVVVQVASGADEVRRTLAEAIEDGCRIQLSYDGANRGMTTHPVVDPVSLVVRGGAAYLQAWNVESEGWRTYKVSRVARARILEDSAVDHGPAPALPETWFSGQEAERVTLDLAPEAHWIVEYDPTDEWHDLPDTEGRGPTRRVTMPLVSETYLTSRLLQLADAVAVVEPQDAGEMAARVARDALQAYSLLWGA